MIDPLMIQAGIIGILVLTEIGLAYGILRLTKQLVKTSERLKKIHRDISEITQFSKDIMKTFRDLQGYDLKFKGKTPLGEAEITVDIERQVL